MTNPTLSLIIPAYNEAGIIVQNIDELAAWVEQHEQGLGFEIIVVDDGSTDGMGALLEDARTTRNWLRVAHHPGNLGRGRGVRTGFEAARGDYLICLDADLSYSPEHVSRLLAPLIAGEADITLASAYHPDGKVVNVPSQRIWLSRLGNKILGLGFAGRLHTVTCIVRGFTREVTENLELVSNGKELHLEVVQKAELLGYRIVEVPATLRWRDRKRGRSKKRGILPEIAILRMRKTVLSHLVFNYVTNPGILLLIPILFLLGIIVAGGSALLIAFVQKWNELDLGLMQTLRQTLLDGQLTLIVVSFAFVFLMIFVGFYFLSFQNKRYFDEIYTIVMRMNARIKKIESRRSEND